ncbi:MAG: hypothetical protein ACLPSF_10065, partial [Methylocella sp.]
LAQILRVSSAHRNPSSNQHGKRITNCAPEESQSDSASRENALVIAILGVNEGQKEDVGFSA